MVIAAIAIGFAIGALTTLGALLAASAVDRWQARQPPKQKNIDPWKEWTE